MVGFVLRKLGLVLAALALFSIAGGHWAVLQSVAWASMLRDYTQQTGSVAAAVQQTFDGEHPCELCRQIAEAKTRERQAEQPTPANSPDSHKTFKVEKKGDAFDTCEVPVIPVGPAAIKECRLVADTCLALSRREAPPVPPPRTATA